MTLPERPFTIETATGPKERTMRHALLLMLVIPVILVAFELAALYRLIPIIRPSSISLASWFVTTVVLGVYCGTLYARGLDSRYDRATLQLKTGYLMIDLADLIFLGLWATSGLIVSKICFSTGIAFGGPKEVDSWRSCFAIGSAVRLTTAGLFVATTLPIYRWAVRTERRDGGTILIPNARWRMPSVWMAAALIFYFYIVGSIFYRLFSL